MTSAAPDCSFPSRWARGLAALAAVIVVATAAMVAFPVDRAEAQPPNTSDWYTIVSRHSGLAFDIQGASTATGAILTQYTNYENANQQFRFIDSGNGHYRIQARHSGQVLDVWNFSTADGGTIAQYTNLNGDNQQWRVTRDSAGYYSFVNRHSGKALDVYNWSTTAGDPIRQWAPTGAANQQFSLIPVGAACGADTVLADIASASK
ncbi:RICIN domain-containing protein [Glycomyces sp. TRM65418]|uniref:RICIN domain-containing protein n=1 Tax=Glycomyces sp. TRM65418 TaxID=2867006 RepID=UPI001CE580FB|nr:RICIN domain-containing protein [Glycomyces sp. TRM65418]MCC3761749.1 RICIN domain-containing protein [Glycomyces sp. TRM65418]QZD55834.1 RICIN domain-containing protein [Glycomyces sp. TRM65418]